MAGKLIPARVLCDVPLHALKAEQLVEAEASLIKALAADGSVDPHKDAVAYARESGAAVVRSAIEVAAEELATAVDAKRVEIAQLQDLQTKADPDTAAALGKKILEVESALADLLA